MSDVSGVSPSSFTNAFRQYAVEQGNDAGAATVKAGEMGNANSGVQAMRSAEVMDTVYISPEAARLYAEQSRELKTVYRRGDPKSGNNTGTTTGEGAVKKDADAVSGEDRPPGEPYVEGALERREHSGRDASQR